MVFNGPHLSIPGCATQSRLNGLSRLDQLCADDIRFNAPEARVKGMGWGRVGGWGHAVILSSERGKIETQSTVKFLVAGDLTSEVVCGRYAQTIIPSGDKLARRRRLAHPGAIRLGFRGPNRIVE